MTMYYAGLMYVVVAIVIFLVCRALVLWYWKIGTIMSLLQDISDSLSNTVQKTEQKQV